MCSCLLVLALAAGAGPPSLAAAPINWAWRWAALPLPFPGNVPIPPVLEMPSGNLPMRWGPLTISVSPSVKMFFDPEVYKIDPWQAKPSWDDRNGLWPPPQGNQPEPAQDNFQGPPNPPYGRQPNPDPSFSSTAFRMIGSVIMLIAVILVSSTRIRIINGRVMPSTSIDRARAFYERGDYDLAMKAYADILIKSPRTVEARQGLADCCFARRDWDRAISYYTETLGLARNNTVALIRRAMSYRFKGDNIMAIASFTRALRINPGSLEALGGLGDCYFSLNVWDLAVDAYSRALLLFPGNRYALTWRNRAIQARNESLLRNECMALGAALPALDPSWLAWNNGTVEKLAQTIHDDQQFDLMPILGDALEDAGCNQQVVLDHCRRPESHAGSCWILDWILGKG